MSILENMNNYNTDDIIFALATAWGKSAIAVIRASGKGCIDALSKAFKRKSSLVNAKTNTLVYGKLFSPSDGRQVDDVVVSVYREGHGYTGEEAFEISCHGGLQVVKAVLDAMRDLGFRQALPGEFTLRAFLHGKMDLTRAEAVDELVNSKGRTGQLMALNRLNGALFKSISDIQAIIVEIMSIIEVQLDYSEDEIGEDLSFPFEKLDDAIEKIERIRSSYDTGRLYSQGARIVLAGPSNAGKSSLFNYFLKEDRSIVSSEKGTTRDFIEASCVIGNIPVRLYDTAGFRELSESKVELEGMRRSRSLLEAADIIIYMADATDAEKPDDQIIGDSRCIPVMNKCDVSDRHLEGFIPVSALTGEGFSQLCDVIVGKLSKGMESCDEASVVIENSRQRENLKNAYDSLCAAKIAAKNELPLDIVSMDVQDALQQLGEITGEVTSDDILDKIFGSFCVGK